MVFPPKRPDQLKHPPSFSKFNLLLRHLPQYCALTQSTRFSTARTSFTLGLVLLTDPQGSNVASGTAYVGLWGRTCCIKLADVTIRTATCGPPKLCLRLTRVFQHIWLLLPHQKRRATLFIDLTNFARTVKFGKHYSGFDRLRACWMGKHRKVYSGRVETSREGVASSIINLTPPPGNN